MKKRNFLKWLFCAMSLFAAMAFTSCVDDNEDEGMPSLKILPETLSFTADGTPASGGGNAFTVRSNRPWTLVIDEEDNWVVADPMTGDEGTTRVSVLVPASSANRVATLKFQLKNAYGVYMTQTATVQQGDIVEPELIYQENFGTAAPSSSPYPLVADYTDWEKGGIGGVTVEYASSGNVSLRASGQLSAGYDGASGSAKCFFGTNNPEFYVQSITLGAGQTDLCLTFGGAYTKNTSGVYDNTFYTDKFHVYVSADGTTWSKELAYTIRSANDYWVQATCDFSLAEAVEKLYIRFKADESSVYAVDDLKLTTGNGGQTVDFTGGGDTPGPDPSEAILHENFGTAAPSSSPYTLVTDYTGWEKGGTSGSSVTYTASGNVSLRASGKLSEGYSDASGSSKLFFGTNSPEFVAGNIALTASQTKLRLSFGGAYSKNNGGTYDNTFYTDKFHVYVSADGAVWSEELTYTATQANEYWVYATCDFTLAKSVDKLYVKFVADEVSVFAIDDLCLTEGDGGQTVDLENGGGDDTGDAVSTTIAELVAKIGDTAMSSATVLDADKDYTFEGVVMNDVTGGNYTLNNLILCTEGATSAKNGVTLYGSQVEPSTLGLNKGDKVKVKLLKGLAKYQNYNGMYELTGDKSATWCEVEKIGTATVAPVVISADQLKTYQGMAVTIKSATTSAAGVWASSDNLTKHTLTAGGTTFTVFMKKGATAFVDQAFVATTGDITGLAAVNSNAGQLVPRNLDDVAAFKENGGGDDNDPVLEGVNPTSLTWEAGESGAQTVSVSGQNLEGATYTISGVSHFTAQKWGNAIAVAPNGANTGSSDIVETLVIGVQGGTGSVSVTLTHKGTGGTAAGGGHDDFETLSGNSSYTARTTDAGWVGENCAVLQGGANDNNPTFMSLLGEDSSVKALCMNGKTSAVGKITSPELSGGCGTLSFDYGVAFAETKPIEFKVEIMQDDAVVKTFTILGDAAPTKFEKLSFSEAVDVTGTFQIVFTNLSPSKSTSNKDRYAIFNISWTGKN